MTARAVKAPPTMMHAHLWSDAWGSHQCSKEEGHDGRCVCECDATARNPDLTPEQRAVAQ